MSRTILAVVAAALVVGLAAPAFAADKCTNEPKSAWKPQEEAMAKATSLGYTASKVKEEDNCWEVYAKDAEGAKFELFFNPVNLELVRKKAN